MYLLRIIVFLVRGTVAENIEEKIETGRIKTLINEDKGKQGKSNNNNEHLWFYFFYKKLYFTKNIVGKKGKKVKSSLNNLISVFVRRGILQTQ